MRIAIVVAAIGALHLNALAAPTAEDLFNEGQAAYDHGDYTLAIDRWQESYRLSKEPGLLFNIAQAYRRAGDCNRALSTYKRFVAIDPTSADRPLADEHVRDLEPKCAAAQAPNVDAPSPSPSPRPGNRSLKLGGLVTVGAGAALVTTGLVFGRRASVLGDEVTRDCAESCDWSTEKAKESAGRRDATVGKILDGIGLTAIAVGVATYLYSARDRRSAIAIQPRANSATLSWCGRW